MLVVTGNVVELVVLTDVDWEVELMNTGGVVISVVVWLVDTVVVILVAGTVVEVTTPVEWVLVDLPVD